MEPENQPPEAPRQDTRNFPIQGDPSSLVVPKTASETLAALDSEAPRPTTSDARCDEDSDNEEESEDENGTQEEEYEDDEDSDEELPIEDPVDDVKGELESVIDSRTYTPGEFYSSVTYDLAPNPGVAVDGVGLLGLPLTEDQVPKLIAACEQAPFGKDNESIVDKAVRDTWEVSSDRIKFLNPMWDRWLHTAALPAISSKLGLSPNSAPKLNLYKLLLYQTGSHFKAHQDTEKEPGMFGTVVVVLPSQFTGGEIHLTHAGKTKIIDTSQSSFMSMSILSWYADVYHSVKPLTAGYRLALTYNLLQPPSLPRPVVPYNGGDVEALRRVLLSWKQDPFSNAPEKLAYRFEHMYSRVGLRVNALKGSDAQLYAFVAPTAKELGFKIQLANIEHVQHGYAEGDYGYDSDACDVEMCEVTEETTRVEYVVDEDGRCADASFDASFDIDQVEEMMPEGLAEGEPDDKEYEGYQGNGPGDLDYIYRASVFLIWQPDEAYCAVRGSILDYVRDNYPRDDEPTPLPKDRHLIERLINYMMASSRSKETRKNAAQALSACALQWRDLALWLRSMQVCGVHLDGTLVGAKDLVEAAACFGFGNIRGLLTDVIDSAESNRFKIDLLDGLLDAAKDIQDGPELVAWCTEQKERALASLKKLQSNDAPVITTLFQQLGVAKVQEIIVAHMASPQLKPSSTTLGAIAISVYNARNSIPPDVESVIAFVFQIVAHVIRETPLFPTKDEVTTQPDWYRSREVVKRPYADDTISLFDLCNLTATLPAFKTLLTDLFTAFDRRTDKTLCVDSYLTPLFAALERRISNSPDAAKQIDYARAYGLYAERLVRYTILDTSELTKVNAQIPVLVNVLRQLPDRIAFLKTNLVPHAGTLAKRTMSLVKELSIALRDVAKGHSEDILNPFLQAIIKNTSLTTSTYPYYSSYSVSSSSSSSSIMDLIKHCMLFPEVDNMALCKQVLTQALSQRTTEHITNTLTAVLRELAVYLPTQKLDLGQEPFRSFAACVILSFVKDVLGPKPTSGISKTEIATVVCSGRCMYCQRVYDHLASDRRGSVEIREKQTTRSHVEHQLQRAGARNWGVTWDTKRYGSPHQLVITKPDRMSGKWNGDQKKGFEILRILGNDAKQRELLGTQYAPIMSALKPASSTGVASVQVSQAAGASYQARGMSMNVRAGTSGTGSAGASGVKRPLAQSLTSQATTGGPSASSSSSISGVRPPNAKRPKIYPGPETEVIELSD